MSNRSFKLFWCTTDETSCCGDAHCEDWFMVARNVKQAASLHDDFEGFEPGDAKAEQIMDLPATWQGVCMHCREPWPKELLELPRSVAEERCAKCDARLIGWPSAELLKACGAKIVDNGPDDDEVVILRGRKYTMGHMEVIVNRKRDDQAEAAGRGRPNGTTASRLMN